MGGSSLGSMFGGPSTIGSNKYAPANTTPSVMGAQGKLEAFNPTTMAGTYNSTTPTPTMENFTGAGLDAASGLPTYVTNFLQQGGTGTLKAPQFTMEGTGVEQKGVQGSQVMQKANIPIAPGGVPPPKPKVNTTTTATTPAAGAGTGLTMVPQGNNNSPVLAVNDQWNFQGGTSMPVASAPLGSGGANSGGGQKPVYQDGKGGFFWDEAGTQPVPAGAAQQFKMMLQSQGHI